MLDIINKYRNSSNRTWIHLLIKTDFSLGSKYYCDGKKEALIDVKCLKRGAFTCHREFNMRLCDLCFLSGAVIVGGLVVKKIMGK